MMDHFGPSVGYAVLCLGWCLARRCKDRSDFWRDFYIGYSAGMIGGAVFIASCELAFLLRE